MAKLSVVIPANEVTVGGVVYRKVERKAQMGDIVKITDGDAPSYLPQGAFFAVDRIDSFGDPRVTDAHDDDDVDVSGYDYEVYEKVTEPVTSEPAPKYREVRRPAKAGERIRIVEASATSGHYGNGDELTVVLADRWNDNLAVSVAEFNHAILHREYVVLEPVDNVAPKPERLKVGEYAKVVNEGNSVTNRGDIVQIAQDDKSEVPYKITFLDGNYAGWHHAGSLVRATESEIEAAKKAIDPRSKFEVGEKVRLISGGDTFPLNDYVNGGIYTVKMPTSTEYSDRVQITGGGQLHGYAKPDQLEKVSAEEIARIEEQAKWAAIGRKVGEYKAGDIVVCTASYGGHPIGTIGELEYDPSWDTLRVKANGFLRSHSSGMQLIVPVEQRFDQPGESKGGADLSK